MNQSTRWHRLLNSGKEDSPEGTASCCCCSFSLFLAKEKKEEKGNDERQHAPGIFLLLLPTDPAEEYVQHTTVDCNIAPDRISCRSTIVNTSRTRNTPNASTIRCVQQNARKPNRPTSRIDLNQQRTSSATRETKRVAYDRM